MDFLIMKHLCEYGCGKERINYFKKFGYSVLIIWENELKNIEQLKNKIKKFNLDKLVFLSRSNRRKKCQDY